MGANIGGMNMQGVLTFVIGVVLVLALLPDVIPVINNALGNVAAIAGLPLVGLFGVNGIIVLAFMGAILIAIFAGVFAFGGKGKK